MNLRAKILLGLGLIFICTTFATNYVADAVLLEDFRKLEVKKAHHCLGQVEKEFRSQVELLDMVNRDWAWWDDACGFVREPNEKFVSSNLPDETFEDLKLNLVGLFDAVGQPVYVSEYDLSTDTRKELSSGLSDFFHKHPFLFYHKDKESVRKGIVLFPEGPMLFASRPILTSERKGPVQGSMILGRYLNQLELSRISEVLQLELSFKFLASTDITDEERTLLSKCLTAKDFVAVEPPTRETTMAHMAVLDVFGKPVVLLSAKLKCCAYEQGHKTIRMFKLMSMSGIALACLVIIMFFERQVFLPLRFLKKSVNASGQRHTGEPDVVGRGSKEFISLAEGINRLKIRLLKKRK